MDKLKNSEHFHMFSKIINEIEDWVSVYDAAGNLEYVNKHAERMSGYTQAELVGHDVFNMLKNDQYNITLKEKLIMSAEQDRKFDTITYLTKKDGTQFYLAITISGIKDSEGKIVNYICMGKDITSAKLLHEKINHMKYIDESTNLPNQTSFIELIYNKVNREEDKPFAVILIDIRKMSYINNTYGLTAGDIVIKEVGSRIQKTLCGRGILSKLNSDVFAIIYESDEESQTKNLVDEVFKCIEKAILLERGELYIELKVGVALYPEHGDAPGKVINKAQIALTKAKDLKGKKQAVFYKEYMQDEVQERMLLESDMHKAIKNNEFIVYYQPFIDLNRKTLKGMEALLRRRKSDGEIVAPGKFIELLEQMQLIEQVGEQVIEAVCKQLKEWRDEGYNVVPVSINLSSVQFRNINLAKDIVKTLEQYDIDPKMIILEITETVVMADIEMAQTIIKELKAYGFMIAIDDFGTGYSSLGYLKKFLFDHLKIDISFIREIVENPQDRAIVAAIISIAKALRLKTVAEGIETLEQLNLMHEMGCEVGQGYYWDAPIQPQVLKEKYLVKLYR